MRDSTKRRGLGRGLDALIVSTGSAKDASGMAFAQGDSNAESVSSAAALAPGNVRMIATDAIQPNPRQPRTYFAEDSLAELAASIRVHGVIQPLLVTINQQRPDLYWLIAGERRLRAAQLAGLPAVPAIVREASTQQLVELALIENVQRADLLPLEEAAAYRSLMTEYGLTQAEVADRVSKSRSAVANIVRLLQLPLPVQNALVEGTISTGHARALLALADADLMQKALDEIVARGLNVRQTEALVKRIAEQAEQADVPSRPQPTAAELAQVTHMEENFRRALGTKVALNRNSDGSGKLVVHFFNDDDLEAIYQQIAGSIEDD